MRDHATNIVRELRRRGFQAYFAGGCVRDTLLGVTPADYDVATDAPPPEVMRIFPETHAVGAQFGVVLVPAPHDTSPPARSEHPNYVEVATFRCDLSYSDGRHPDEVRYSKSPQEDVQRRDFTINGLLMDPLDGDRVLDFVGGRDDLAAGIVRAIGDPQHRFQEDKLRMLRAVRFSARLQYTIEPQTFAAIRELAPFIHQVSRERVRDELTKMLTEGHARRRLRAARRHRPAARGAAGGRAHERRRAAAAVPSRRRRVGTHAVAAGEAAAGSLAHAGLGRAAARCRQAANVSCRAPTASVSTATSRWACAWPRRFAIACISRNDDTKQIVELVANHMRFADVERMKESTLKRFLRLPSFDEHLELHRIDSLSSHGNLSLYDFVRERRSHTSEEEIRPALLLNGDDLIGLGYRPGPKFREMLGAIEDAQLEGTLHTREEALSFVLSQFPLAS